MRVSTDEHGKNIPPKSNAVEYLNLKINNGDNLNTPKIPAKSNDNVRDKLKILQDAKANQLRIHEVKESTPVKIHNTTDDDDDNLELEVDEHVAYASNYKSSQKDLPDSSNRGSNQIPKSHDEKYKRAKQVKNKGMIKSIPKFFKDDTRDSQKKDEELESAYTELARKLFLQQLEGRGNKKEIYSLMTNEHKLRSVIEKKHVNKRVQKTKDSQLYTSKIGGIT